MEESISMDKVCQAEYGRMHSVIIFGAAHTSAIRYMLSMVELWLIIMKD